MRPERGWSEKKQNSQKKKKMLPVQCQDYSAMRARQLTAVGMLAKLIIYKPECLCRRRDGDIKPEYRGQYIHVHDLSGNWGFETII
jgi:hypothetical protein